MSSFESSGFPPPPEHPHQHQPAGQDGHAQEQPLVPLAPLQPFDEVQPLQTEPAPEPFQPLEAAPVETFHVQPVETAQLQPVEPPQPLEPLNALEPVQPMMPPPLPLLTLAEQEPAAPVAPAASPEEVANLGVPLGTLIFRAGLLTEEQLEEALQEGLRSGKRLGEVLLESGLLNERDLGRLLADQKGLRFVELSSLTLDPAASTLLSSEKAHMYAALPVGFEDGVPLVAVADPSNELVTENLRRALGSEPRLLVASRSDLHATIDRVNAPVAEQPVAQPEPPVVEDVPSPTPAPVGVVEPVEPMATAPFAPTAPQSEPSLETAPLTAPEVEPLVEPVSEPVVSSPQPEPEPVAQAAPAPAPVLKPVEVERVQPEPPQPESNGYATAAPLVTETPEPTPEPAVAPEPVPLQPPAPEPVTLQPPAPEPTYSRVDEEPRETVDSEQELPSALSYDVSLRLTDGERVPVGSFADAQKAREYAREVVKHLSDEGEGWPFFSGRFMRPDTIVSVDIVPVGEPDRWLGSAVRSNWASRLNR